jgi:HAD superfamily hydrolase (TIGR01509 family)
MLAADLAKDLPADHFIRGFGMKNEVIIPNLLGWTSDLEEIRRLSLRKEALYREIIQAQGVTALPGVEPWLKALAEAEIPCVIGSSTHRKNIEVSLDKLGFHGYFREMVTAEDVSHGKPHPEVFLKAAQKIGVSPERCVVFEDAHVGIQAARAAGMKVVAVATTNRAEELTAADRVVHRLDELKPEDLAAWFSFN